MSLVLIAMTSACQSSGGGPAADHDGSGASADDGSRGDPVVCGGEQTHTGDATYYSADGSGACGFAPTPGDLMVGAMNAADFRGSEPCGACARVVGPSGAVTIRIVDLCPECAPGSIDLSRQAFEKIAPIENGRVSISWDYAPCEVSGPITYRFKEGSNAWWTAVQVRNARHRVTKLEFEKDGGFVSVPRFDYNYFVAESGMGEGPLKLRVTDIHGAVLVDDNIQLADGGDRTGGAQFPSCQ